MEHRLPEILEEAAQVRDDLGYPIVVSPFAQYIVTQAVLNVVQRRALQDDSRRNAQVRDGLLWKTRGASRPPSFSSARESGRRTR